MYRQEELQGRLKELEAENADKQAAMGNARRQLYLLEAQMEYAQRIMKIIKGVPSSLKSAGRSTGAYILGRRNIKKLYSKTYKRKDAQNKLKKYTYRLYDLGFTEQALKDLEYLYASNDNMLRRAAAWELSLWHANKYTMEGAHAALIYLPTAVEDTKDPAFLRRAAIIAAECADRLGMKAAAIHILNTVMDQRHADLYLARANLEVDLESRTEWINKANDIYGIAPIFFSGSSYESLSSPPLPTVDGPKVTVIMPAYNVSQGIGTGIESILSQTWKNVELLIVDDRSSDGTLSAAEEYAKRDDRVIVLSTPENSGPYIARNIALKRASGEYITVNDADDWSHPEKLEIQVRHLMDNPQVVANTSGHARLTEELKLHRRGTPGTYIFSNMSSLMFRSLEVSQSVGCWDNVRFAGDSEFKRRISEVFGPGSVVDLDSGPLSFPRQASGSLTSSSAFGYKGFLMGVRREYAEVYRRHHRNTPASELRKPCFPKVPFYPVPEPMWIHREKKDEGYRHFDVVIIGDFRKSRNHHQGTLEEIRFNRKRGLRTGIIQMADYDFEGAKEVDESIRELIDGESVQMLVYGEHIHTEVLLLKDPGVFKFSQEYTPVIKARVARGVVEKPFKGLRDCARNASAFVGKELIWHPYDDSSRTILINEKINLSMEKWTDYNSKIENWMMQSSSSENQGR
ncbi:glycosyltransferase family 2 protein [Salinicoccus roseus]|uniref:glycosyltransferase family 2 protein n=1 Tax=Salinicoccus roseus TaxID=45670 RepID=UPI003D9FC740